MRSIFPSLLATAGSLCVAVTTAGAQNNTSHAGDVIQSIPPSISQNTKLPLLHLSDVRRGKIKQVLSGQDTEVTFSLKATQSARSFNPAVGATIPPSLRAYALPPPLIYEMPNLKRYTYLKFKGQVLIVNPMNRKIVDMFSET
jgi:hypothetical protein